MIYWRDFEAIFLIRWVKMRWFLDKLKLAGIMLDRFFGWTVVLIFSLVVFWDTLKIDLQSRILFVYAFELKTKTLFPSSQVLPTRDFYVHLKNSTFNMKIWLKCFCSILSTIKFSFLVKNTLIFIFKKTFNDLGIVSHLLSDKKYLFENEILLESTCVLQSFKPKFYF